MRRWMAGGEQQTNLEHLFDTKTIGPHSAAKDVYTKYMVCWPGVSINVFSKKFNQTMNAKCGVSSPATGKATAARSDATAPMLDFRPFNHTGGGGVATSTTTVAAAAPGGNGIPSGEYS